MKHQRSHDPWEALLAITEAAEGFVNRSPRSKRLEAERQALLDAIRQAQLILSVKRLPTLPKPNPEPVTNLADHRKGRQSKQSANK
jgi:hypothetical protein